jgi:hypothetical protein
MPKNRKNQAADIRFGPVLKVVLLCSLIGGSAIGYVWQKNQINRLGLQISDYEKRLKQIKSDNKLLTDSIAYLRSPVTLDRRVKELNLGLTPAQPLQVVRLVEQPPASAQESSHQLALRPVAGATP